MTGPSDSFQSSIAVVGAGAAGTLTAIHLLRTATRRCRSVHVLLLDPAARVGRGVAYAANDERHRLNVPTANMSALPQQPGHFFDWVRTVDPAATPDGFAPRARYGDYLEHTLRAAAAAAPASRLEVLRERVTALHPDGARARLELASGAVRTVDRVVLAPGHGGPGLGWAPAALRDDDRVVGDPWRPGALDRVPDSGDVLVVGAGLTAMDVVVSLAAPGRVVHVVSRHGVTPYGHREGVPTMEPPELPASTVGLAELRRIVAVHVALAEQRYGDWRPAVDSLRPLTQRLWAGLDGDDRREFLATDVRRWDARRHRMAPETARQVEAAQATGQVLTHRDGVTAAEATDATLRLTLGEGDVLEVAAVVNCTGPGSTVDRRDDPLVAGLLAAGSARPGSLGLGLDTDDDGRVLAGGGPQLPMWTLGGLRQGQLWETTAIPEIRAQAATLAELLLPAAASSGRSTLRDQHGLELSTTAEAADRWCAALGAVLELGRGADRAVRDAVQLDPGFALGHVTLALLGREWEVDADIDSDAELATAVACVERRGTDRERSFVHAVTTRLGPDRTDGDRELLRHLAAYPRDALAVSLALPTIAFSGIDQPVEDAWELVETLTPAYGDDGWFAGILAFARQEQGRFDEAGRLSDRSLSELPAAGHAAHARTHVYYETGEHRAGLAWLDSWIAAHAGDSAFPGHFSWHAALHELAVDDAEAVNRRYAAELAPPEVTGVRALVDSASMLWRSWLGGTRPMPLPIGEVLATVPEEAVREPGCAFLGLHAAIALAANRDGEGLHRLAAYSRRHPHPTVHDGLPPLCEGLAALLAGDPATAADQLAVARDRSHLLGGSAAQRQVVDDTWIHALVEAGRTEQAHAVINARLDRRPGPADRRRLAELEPAGH